MFLLHLKTCQSFCDTFLKNKNIENRTLYREVRMKIKFEGKSVYLIVVWGYTHAHAHTRSYVARVHIHTHVQYCLYITVLMGQGPTNLDVSNALLASGPRRLH